MIDPVLTKVGERVNDDWHRNVNPDEQVIVEITQDAINYQGDAPRIVFEPLGGPIVRQNVASQDGKKQPRNLFTRLETVRAHCWGEDRTGTEKLIQALMRQSYGLLWGSYEPQQGTWLNSSATKRGNVYLLVAVYQIPVPRETEATTPIDQFENTGEFVEPASI